MRRDYWYKESIIYNLDLETFLDSDGDGVGDFPGLIRRLDYLDALGVDTVWLAPFQPTPNRDNGYDIKDYFGVDPRHGSSGDFVTFVHAASLRGIKVIIDLVVNHTSDQHPWFQAARKDPDSPYRDWYVWADEPGDEVASFSKETGSAWTYDDEAGAYYFHRFYPFQPDLNLDNPSVREEIERIMGYWLQLGVAGFRMDAVPYLIESCETEEELTRRFGYLRRLRDFVQWRRGDAIMLGEANLTVEDSLNYLGEEDEVLHMLFNFPLNQTLVYALATGDATRLKQTLEASQRVPPRAQWAIFLRNHDELNLDKLSEDEQEQVFAAFGPEEEMQVYGRGIRRRLAPMLNDRERLELAYSLLFSLPGTPVLYYGEEIGMGENLDLEERTAVRTPMQWANEANAAFSRADELIRPVREDGPYGYAQVNVEDQRRHPDSLLNWISGMIRLRKESPAIGRGDWELIDPDDERVLVMRYVWEGSTLLIVHNFVDAEISISLSAEVCGSTSLYDLRGGEDSVADGEGAHRIDLVEYGYRWFRVGDLTHFLERWNR